MSGSSRQDGKHGSERQRLDPFVVATGDASPRDQRDLMERPFFSLSKTPRVKPILYKAADVEVQVLGMACPDTVSAAPPFRRRAEWLH